MEYVCIGKIVTTHGLKGELKISSNFKYKDQVFNVGKNIYIGKDKECHEILSYRKHQDYDMVILSDILDIDVAIPYKKELVYVLKNDIKLNNNDYLDEDLINLDAYFNNAKIGVIKSITDEGNNNFIIRLDNAILIPKNDNFILNVDLELKRIDFKNLEGLL